MKVRAAKYKSNCCMPVSKALNSSLALALTDDEGDVDEDSDKGDTTDTGSGTGDCTDSTGGAGV